MKNIGEKLEVVCRRLLPKKLLSSAPSVWIRIGYGAGGGPFRATPLFASQDKAR